MSAEGNTTWSGLQWPIVGLLGTDSKDCSSRTGKSISFTRLRIRFVRARFEDALGLVAVLEPLWKCFNFEQCTSERRVEPYETAEIREVVLDTGSISANQNCAPRFR